MKTRLAIITFTFFILSCEFNRKHYRPMSSIQLEISIPSNTSDKMGISMTCSLKIHDPHYIFIDFNINNDGTTTIAIPSNLIAIPAIYNDGSSGSRYIQNIYYDYWRPPDFLNENYLILISPGETKTISMMIELYNWYGNVAGTLTAANISSLKPFICRSYYWPWYDQPFPSNTPVYFVDSQSINFRALPYSKN